MSLWKKIGIGAAIGAAAITVGPTAAVVGVAGGVATKYYTDKKQKEMAKTIKNNEEQLARHNVIIENLESLGNFEDVLFRLSYFIVAKLTQDKYYDNLTKAKAEENKIEIITGIYGVGFESRPQKQLIINDIAKIHNYPEEELNKVTNYLQNYIAELKNSDDKTELKNSDDSYNKTKEFFNMLGAINAMVKQITNTEFYNFKTLCNPNSIEDKADAFFSKVNNEATKFKAKIFNEFKKEDSEPEKNSVNNSKTTNKTNDIKEESDSNLDENNSMYDYDSIEEFENSNSSNIPK
ncbi:MAG: hypothetical protein R3Y52_03020 [Psittacicella sp.]